MDFSFVPSKLQALLGQSVQSFLTHLHADSSQEECRRSGSFFFWFLLLYGVGLLCLLPQLSLWLDEILDLRIARDESFSTLFPEIARNAGAAPLGYLLQKAAMAGFSYSRWSGRLPSALGSALGCMGLFQLSRQLPLRCPLLAVLLFALSPLQVRYALEARPYSLALALSIWASVLFLDLLVKPTLTLAFWYGCFALAGLYTQPYSLFVPLAHLTWLVCFRREPMRPVLLVTGALAFAAIGFLPWYCWASRAWTPSLAQAPWSSGISFQTGLLILRELSGAGYPGTVLLLVSAGLGWQGLHHRRSLWALVFTLPAILVLLADEQFGYFFAIRQIIFVLPPLSLLAALGIEARAQHRPLQALIGGVLLFVLLLISDIRFFQKPREDWERAAQILQTLTKQGHCVIFVPTDSEPLYRFFVPALKQRSCTGQEGRSAGIVVAVSPYKSSLFPALEKQLIGNGYRKQAEYNPQGPRVEWYR